MRILHSHSVAETEAFGEVLGQLAHAGQVIGLAGDLGAGKTALTRGIARGLGCPGRVHSPTFALLNQYEGGRCPLFHLDLYRLNSAEEVREAGLEEYLVRPAGVSVVEWMERWPEGVSDVATGEHRWWRVWMSTLDEDSREIRHDVPGA